jgi:predicted pyridoxine 5'-phosphate oxidase superfamily flavin-nucleotide-binding protein
MRVNGHVARTGDGLTITADQVFANCPKYITPREVPPPSGVTETGHAPGLTDAQRAVVARADTFFVGTHVPGRGADASHRGGPPGFVTVTGPRTLSWPDYRGNAMYLTLGNLELDPACGLLFPDWVGGRPLRLTGRAAVDWDPARAASVPGAERMIDFELDATA